MMIFIYMDFLSHSPTYEERNFKQQQKIVVDLLYNSIYTIHVHKNVVRTKVKKNSEIKRFRV